MLTSFVIEENANFHFCNFPIKSEGTKKKKHTQSCQGIGTLRNSQRVCTIGTTFLESIW